MQGNDYTVIKKLKRIKSEGGITLITLVVTIVIILILSTVAISVIFGDNGFLQKVQGIKDSAQQSIADDTEKTNLVFEEYANLMAEDMGIAEPGIPGGAITFEDVKWTGNGTATVVVKTSSTGLTLQYQVNSTTGNWTTIQSGATIQNLRHGNKVYARLYDGTNESEYEVKEILDEIPPIVTIEVTDLTWDGVQLNVTASDGQSGLATSGRYTYYLDNTKKVSNNTSSYKYTGLTGSTKYTLKVVVKDNAGKTSEVSVIITTPQRVITVESKLKEGDYVYFVDKTGVRRKCAVLYGPENENYSSYGIQIITMETLGQVTIGTDSESSYVGNDYSDMLDYFNNDLINRLNEEASKYLNTTYAKSARCVGTLPDEPSNNDQYNILNTGAYPMSEKDNCKIDVDKLVELHINDIGTSYVLASLRSQKSNDTQSDVTTYMIWTSSGTCWMFLSVDPMYSGSTMYYTYENTFNIRSVFTLKEGLKIVYGEGTSDSPYVLEL